MGFAGFNDVDFDAYEEKKWTSNRFNLERMRTRERLETLAKEVFPADRLTRLGLEMSSSHDHPTLFNHRSVDSQWVFVVRNQDEQKRLTSFIDREHSIQVQVGDPALYHLHAIVGLRLHHAGLDVLFGIHQHAGLDLKNLAQKCDTPYERNVLVETLKTLPESLRFVCGDTDQSCAEVDDKSIRSAVLRLSTDANAEWLQFVLTLSRAELLSLAERAVTHIKDPISSLLTLYVFAAWRRDNDFISLQKTIKEDKKAKKANSNDLAVHSRVKVKVGLFSGRDGQVVELDGKGGVRILVGNVPIKVRVQDVHPID